MTVTRTGGFAGITTRATVDLAALPAAERRDWNRLVETMPTIAARPPHPDAFTYHLAGPGVTPVSVAENALPPELLSLLRSVLRG